MLKLAILNRADCKPGDLTKRHQILAHFSLKNLSYDSINRDRFHFKNFLKIQSFKPAKKSRDNFDWSIPLKLKINTG